MNFLGGKPRAPVETPFLNSSGRVNQEWLDFFAGLSDPDASTPDLLVGSAPARNTAEWLVTDTATVQWDRSTSGQPRAIIPDGAIKSDKIDDHSVTFVKIQEISTDKLLGRDTAGTGDVEEIGVTNGLEFTGSATIGIANDAVTNARLANMAQATIKGRQSGGGTGDPEDLTGTQAAVILPDASTTQRGVIEHATDAEIRACTTGNTAIPASGVESASASVALTDAATVAVNWDSGINFTLTVTANRIIGNPTNGQPGTWRTILVQGNNSTDRTITFDSQYLGETPTITTCDSTRWFLLMIFCVSSTHFVVSSKRALGAA